MRPPNLDSADFQLASTDWLCSACNWIKPIDKAVDVRINASDLTKVHLSFIFGTGLPLVHKSLLDLVNHLQCDKEFVLGKVYSKEGVILDEWKTVNSRNRVIIRGSKNVSHRICEVCKRNVYFAQGKPYLSLPFPAMNRLNTSDLSGLVLMETTHNRADFKCLNGVEIEEIPLSEDAVDGFREMSFYASVD